MYRMDGPGFMLLRVATEELRGAAGSKLARWGRGWWDGLPGQSKPSDEI